MIDRIKNDDEFGNIMIGDTHVDNKPDTKLPWIPTRAEAQDGWEIHWMNKEYKRLLAQVMGFPPSGSERKKVLKALRKN